MAWLSLADIDSVSLKDNHEYFSRPDERILELVSEKNSDIVVYGAAGKFMRHVTLMLIRAIRETGGRGQIVHLVSSLRQDPEFDELVKNYQRCESGRGFVQRHSVDLLHSRESDLKDIPSDSAWVLYGVGYKFKKSGEADEEYARMYRLYGREIPSLVFSRHQQDCEIVMMGSCNGVSLTPVDRQAPDDAPLVPSFDRPYGLSILAKEQTLHGLLERPGFRNPSRAVILRGAYFTDLTYGGLETEIQKILKGEVLDVGPEGQAYFNLYSHRDAAIYMILAADLVSHPVATFNCSGPTVSVREAAVQIAENLKIFHDVKMKANVSGVPADEHLLADGRRLEEKLGKSLDSLQAIIRGQTYWVVNGGFRRGLDHLIGKSL